MTAPLPSRTATDLTNHVAQRMAVGDYPGALRRVEQVLAETRAQGYEAGLAAARRGATT